MTTDIRYEFVNDVSQNNDILVLEPTEPGLSAGVWIVLRESRMDLARLGCLSYVVDLLCTRDPTLERWVIVGHRALQPPSTIAKHFGIGKYLSRKGFQFRRNEILEHEHKYEGGVRFVGAMQWDTSDMEAVNACMMTERAVIILAKGTIARTIVTQAITNYWVVEEREPFGVLSLAVHEPIVLLEAYGEFDDREVAVAAIGRKEFLRTLGVVPKGA